MTGWAEAHEAIARRGEPGAALRRAIADELIKRECIISGATKKMLSVALPNGVTFGWEYDQTLQTFHFARDHEHLLPKDKVTWRKHSGRSSIKLGYEGPAHEIFDVNSLAVLDALGGNLAERTLDLWVMKFLGIFSGFETFPAKHPQFEEEERSGPGARKQVALELAQSKRSRVTDASSALAIADQIVQASHIFTQSKMIFRTMTERIGTPPETIMPLFSDVPSARQFAVFIDETVEFAISTSKGKPDLTQFLTGANALMMFLHPDTWIEINQTRRNQALMALFGEQAPIPKSVEDCAQADYRIGQTVFDGLKSRGLKPRDMIDVQGFIWRVLNNEATPEAQVDENPANPTSFQEATMTPVNTILYGPPGTGKTYETAARAVKICDGTVSNDRNVAMARYRELLEANRIEFITFHQSYGYEEFVEGLRPTSGAEDGDADVQTGFSLKVRDGVLKKIAGRAKNAPKAVSRNYS
jgi:hypothetical protein